MARSSILEYLDNFRLHAADPAYVFRRGYRLQRWSYGDVLQNAYRFARALEMRDIGKGDKVLIWGENCAEWIVDFLRCHVDLCDLRDDCCAPAQAFNFDVEKTQSLII